MSSDERALNTLARLQAHARLCRRCPEAGHAVAGQPICTGPGTAQVMIVGQAPSLSDDQNRRMWSGPAGRRLMAWLAWAGLPEEVLRARHYLTAICKCYPGRAPGGHGDLTPSAAQVNLCRAFLDSELALVAPRLLIPVGRMAIDAFGGKGRPLEALVGRAVCVDDTWIVPLPHPSGASLWLNQPENQALLARALALVRELARNVMRDP